MSGVARASIRCSTGDVSWSVLAVVLIKVVVAFVILLVSVMLYIWGMRKVIADMQNRIGPNRAGPYGVLQTLADGIKLFFKEQSIPTTADRPVFRLAPYLSILPAFLMFCVVPIGGTVSILGHETYLQVADLPGRRAVHPRDVGPRRVRRDARGLVVGLEVPAARRGALDRAAALVRSRVRPRRSSACSSRRSRSRRTRIVDAAGLDRPGLVRRATGSGCARWCRSRIFLIAATAETNHPPFDLVEAEQELVGGFNTEYTGIRFAIFFLAEFMNVITMSAIAATLFLGGPSGPLIGTVGNWIRQHLGRADVLVPRQAALRCCSERCGCARRCRACATTG